MPSNPDAPHDHALLPGATKGIGVALARLRGEHPAGRSEGLVLDLRDHVAAREAGTDIGTVDHLVLCGSSDVARGLFASLSVEAVAQALHMKLIGYLNAVQAVLPQLSEPGSITFVGGAASRAAMPGTVGLAAVNGALEAVTRTLAREIAPRRVNPVSPGLTDTEAYAGMPAEAKAALFSDAAAKLPVGRVGQVDDIAAAIAFVIANPFVTAPWCTSMAALIRAD